MDTSTCGHGTLLLKKEKEEEEEQAALGEGCFSGDEVKSGGAWANTVIVEDAKIGEESSRGLNNTNLQVSKGDKFGVHKMVSLGVTGVSFHDIKLRVLIGERDGGNHIGTLNRIFIALIFKKSQLILLP